VKRIVPFLKIDKGLADSDAGAQIMKPIPNLDDLLARARDRGIFGTKMRSLITLPGAGLEAVVDQQFAVTRQILPTGLVPIVETEIDVHSPRKSEAEEHLESALLAAVNRLDADQLIMLKLTLPETDNQYRALVEHPNVLRVLALSGGYGKEEANDRLARNNGVIASFSRAFTEGLSIQQSTEEFDKALDHAIASIAAASST